MWSGILNLRLFLQYSINYRVVLEIIDISVSRDSSFLALSCRNLAEIDVGEMSTLGWSFVLISAQLGQTLDKLLGWLYGLGVNDDLQLPQRIGLPGSCLDMCLVRLLLLESVLSQILHVRVVFL